MPGYRAPRPGDLLAVRSSDPRFDEAHVQIDTVADTGDYLLLSGTWQKTNIEIVIRRVGEPTLKFLEY